MVTRTANDAKIVALTQQGRATDQETKDDAFRLWIENGRSWKRVNDLTGIPLRTLHDWGTADNWQQRRLEQAQSFLPGANAETGFALKLAAYNASIRLQQLAFDANENGTDLDLKQIQALTLIVDRGGFSPVGSKTMAEPNLKPAEEQMDAISLAGRSPEELMLLEQQARARKKR